MVFAEICYNNSHFSVQLVRLFLEFNCHHLFPRRFAPLVVVSRCLVIRSRKRNQANAADDRPEERPDPAAKSERQTLSRGEAKKPSEYNIPALIRTNITRVHCANYVEEFSKRLKNKCAQQADP